MAISRAAFPLKADEDHREVVLAVAKTWTAKLVGSQALRETESKDTTILDFGWGDPQS